LVLNDSRFSDMFRVVATKSQVLWIVNLLSLARVAEFGRRTGLRIRRGNPWGFESPLSHHKLILSILIKAAQSLIISLAATVLVVLPALGQNYGNPMYYQYYPYYYYLPENIPQQGQLPRKKGGLTPYHYYLVPSPNVYKKWNRQNRWSDFQQLQRSPLNPETDLEYMLRTF
jgi:hypothetical protein